MKKKQYKSNPREISLKYLKEILDIISLIETSGCYYKTMKSAFPSISSDTISEILLNIQDFESKEDWSRTIKTAGKVFNEVCRFSEIKGDRRGSYISLIEEKGNRKDLRKDAGYQALFIIGLAILSLEEHLNLDFLNQFFMQKHPLGFLMFLSLAIERKMILKLKYRSDRTEAETEIKQFVPGKINFRDGHWVVIGMVMETRRWIQYLVHNIISIEIYKKYSDDEPSYFKDLPDLNLEKFYEKSFGLSVLDGQETFQIAIEVPLKYKEKIVKRRKEGSWTEEKGRYIWTISTHSPDEVMDYVFKWKGEIKIISPQAVKIKFKDRLHKILSDLD